MATYSVAMCRTHSYEKYISVATSNSYVVFMPIIRVRLNEDLYKMLVEISRKENKSISDVVRDAIRFYYSHRDTATVGGQQEDEDILRDPFIQRLIIELADYLEKQEREREKQVKIG